MLFISTFARIRFLGRQFREFLGLVKGEAHELRISNLAKSVLAKVDKQPTELEKYAVIINHLNILDKGLMLQHHEKIVTARAREAYYKELSSHQSKRSALESLFQRVTEVISADEGIQQSVLQDVRNHITTVKVSLATIQRAAPPAISEDIDKQAARRFEEAFLVFEPEMTAINWVLAIPAVYNTLKTHVGWTIPVPIFTGRVVCGVLSERAHDPDYFIAVMIGKNERFRAFYEDLARMCAKPVDLYDEAEAHAGESIVMKGLAPLLPTKRTSAAGQ